MAMVFGTAWSGFYFKLLPHCENSKWSCTLLMVVVALGNAAFFTYCLLRLAYAHCRNRMPDVQKHLKRAKAYFRRQGKRIVLQNAESNPMAEAAFENPMYRAKRKTTMKTSMQAKRLEMRKIRTAKHARLGNSLLHPIRTPAQIGPHATLPPKSRAVQVLRQRIECALWPERQCFNHC